jgi:hypothetical protein
MNKSKYTTPTMSDTTAINKQTLILIKSDSLFYPRTEEDHQLLSSLKIPITKISPDYFPILDIFCKKKRIKIKVISFDLLEQAMLTKTRSKWGHDLTISPQSLLFAWPRALRDVKVDKMVESLQTWYRKHNIKTEVVSKKTSKAHRLMIKKVRD